MLKNLYVVYDKLAQTTMGQILAFPNDASAVRYFVDVASGKDTIVNKHLGDYELRRVGQIEETTGQLQIAPDHTDVVVVTGDQVRAILSPEA